MTRRLVCLVVFFAAAVVLLGAVVMQVARDQRAASTERCINNLRRIDAAKCYWAEDTRTNTTATPSVREISFYLGCDMKMPSCPGGGSYTIGPIGEDPRCSLPEHVYR